MRVIFFYLQGIFSLLCEVYTNMRVVSFWKFLEEQLCLLNIFSKNASLRPSIHLSYFAFCKYFASVFVKHPLYTLRISFKFRVRKKINFEIRLTLRECRPCCKMVCTKYITQKKKGAKCKKMT